jgi:hypothetical protein
LNGEPESRPGSGSLGEAGKKKARASVRQPRPDAVSLGAQ